ncbi:MAG TPA: branched-chain amino acid ABC transporter permease [Gaiellaceae bacterium]|nr:branched-chain amino acid ABC transporter permease [Gaiellaceae bacterium]
MTLAFLNLTWPTFADGLELGGIYALMAVGIGLVFGVLRLVNFAYGQLIMAGAYALAYGATWNLPNWESILLCFGVVLVLSVLMDRLVFRPLRLHSPAVMLVATFAVAFLLQNVALLKFGALPRSVGSLALLNAPWDIFGVEIKKIAVISVATAVGSLTILQLLLTRTPLGLHMRAAATDFRTARLLGVRANRVIGAAVILSGLLAAVSAVMLSVQDINVVPAFGLQDTIVVLAGVVLGGLNRPIPATLGGFAIGFATGILGGVLSSNQVQYLPAFVFAAVIVVLLLRPNGLFTRATGAVERV